MFFPSMEMSERLRCCGSRLFEVRRGREDAWGKEKNRTRSLIGCCTVWLLLSTLLEMKDKGAGKTSSRALCCEVLRYGNEGSSSSSETGDEVLCISACRSRTIREWAWQSVMYFWVFFSKTGIISRDERVARACVG